MKRLIAILIPIVVLGALISWRLVQKKSENAAMERQRTARAGTAPNVSLTTAQLRDIESVYEATGTLEAPLNVKISPKVSGRINFLQVHEGDAVGKGQVLVRIDSSEVEAQVRQQEAALAEAQYRLAQALINQAPTEVGISTEIRQQLAAVASAQADYDQVRQNLEAQVATAQAGVVEMQGRADSANAAIDNARAGISSAQANLNNVNIRLNRILELYQQGFIAAQDVDDAKAAVSVQQAAVEVAQGQLRSTQAAHASALAQVRAAEQQVEIVRTRGEADVEAARQKLAQANASLEYARANAAQSPAYKQGLAALKASVEATRAALSSARARRADTVLTSPLDGRVTGRFADPGDMAGAGQAILAVQFFKQVWVSISVPDDVAGRIHLGQETIVWFDSLPDRTFAASVVQINPSADPQTRQFTVRAIMSNDEDLFRPGMFAHVSLVTQKESQLVAVPREAVQHDEAGDYVFVVDDQNKVERRPVSLGLSDADFIGITEGLKPGERVVTISSIPIKEGQVVETGEEGGRGGGERPAGAPAASQQQPGRGQ